MKENKPSRHRNSALLAALLVMAVSLPAQPSGPHSRPSAPQVRVGPRPNQEHLAQWMDRHRSLPLSEQQRALDNEPGFRDLSPQIQQRMRDRLTQLNNMTPEKRQRVLERAEALEHLSPQQRQQFRSAMLQLGSLPEDRRRAVARAFRDLRDTPSADRNGVLASDRFRQQFSDQERSTLSSLIAVEAYLPTPPPAQPSQAR